MGSRKCGGGVQADAAGGEQAADHFGHAEPLGEAEGEAFVGFAQHPAAPGETRLEVHLKSLAFALDLAYEMRAASTIESATASAVRMPSTPAERMPPA